MPEPEQFPASLAAWRKAYRLRQADVARILGYSTGHLSRCERGDRKLSDNAWRVLLAHVAGREAL